MNNVGCAYPYYPAQAGYDPFGGSAYPLATMPMQGLGGYAIVGQAAPPATVPEKSMTDKAKDFLNKEQFGGVKNGYWLGGAAALGAIWYGYSAGWFGR